jgi:hypothetical protein
VKRVRIVRDKDTQLGKGIAYVQFAVRSSLSLNSSRVPQADDNLDSDLGPRMRRRDTRSRAGQTQVCQTQAARRAL